MIPATSTEATNLKRTTLFTHPRKRSSILTTPALSVPRLLKVRIVFSFHITWAGSTLTSCIDVAGEFVRNDIKDREAGVQQIFIDTQVIDVNTCDPVPDILLELWRTNPFTKTKVRLAARLTVLLRLQCYRSVLRCCRGEQRQHKRHNQLRPHVPTGDPAHRP